MMKEMQKGSNATSIVIWEVLESVSGLGTPNKLGSATVLINLIKQTNNNERQRNEIYSMCHIRKRNK